MGNEDDDITAIGSPDDISIRGAADAIGGIARAVEENLRLVLTVPPEHRDRILWQVALHLGELGDLSHEWRRFIMRARGVYNLR